jgi:regulatory protein
VRVELDGEPWRTLPLEPVVRAGLAVGLELDRVRVRTLRRELRRDGALTTATRALARRERSAATLAAHLEESGVAPRERAATLGVLERAGYVDDARFAGLRAAALATRGYGDAAIRFDLEQQGVAAGPAGAALAALEPEADRAAALLARRGVSAAALRRLAARGFGEDAIESALAAFGGGDATGP